MVLYVKYLVRSNPSSFCLRIALSYSSDPIVVQKLHASELNS